jgi:hypothetical protein
VRPCFAHTLAAHRNYSLHLRQRGQAPEEGAGNDQVVQLRNILTTGKREILRRENVKRTPRVQPTWAK